MAAADLTEPYGYQTASEMLAHEVPPTAFLVSSYVVALRAANMLVEQINNPGGKSASKLIDTQLVIGCSTGPCKS